MDVAGKQQLCVCNDYKKYFKSIQGRNGFTLFKRYKNLENIVNKNVDGKYHHFLAQPELKKSDIYWFTQPYYENPRRLSDLEGQERADYERVKDETLSHYRMAVANLRAQNKSAEAITLASAIKFVNDDFIYCYDGKTVLGIWGMELRDEVREPFGVAMQNNFEKPQKRPEEPEKLKQKSDTTDDSDTAEEGDDIPRTPRSERPDDPNRPLRVRFSCGKHGTLHGQSRYNRKYGEQLYAGEIPHVVPEEGYRFAGWDKNPVNYVVRKDTVFIARYESIEEESFWSHYWGYGSGCLNWGLLLLLLVLFGVLIWYLLGRHPFNFCGCDCCCDKVVVVDPPIIEPVIIDTIYDVDDVTPPTRNCGVHFSGWFLSDREDYPHDDCSEIFQDENYGEYVGQGYYTDNTLILPKAMTHSFDAVAVSRGTRLIMYEKPKFEGRVVLDVQGPMLVENVTAKGMNNYDILMTYTFKDELQELFPPERRQWSSEDMNKWAYGSCKIICE